FLLRPREHHYILFPYTTLFRSLDSADRCASQRTGMRIGLYPRVRENYHDAPVRARLHSTPVLARRGSERWGNDEHGGRAMRPFEDRKSTRLNSSHQIISYAVFC